MKSLLPVLLALGLCTSAFAAGLAHQHGVARLDVAVEPGRVTLELDTPLDNLLGFERAPRNAAERQAVDAVVAQLKAADQLFKVDPAAGCKLDKVELNSAVLKLGTPDPAEAKDGHADIDGDFSFTCADAGKASYIDVGLFRFDHLQRLEVQVATPKGQFKRDLKRPTQRLSLTK